MVVVPLRLLPLCESGFEGTASLPFVERSPAFLGRAIHLLTSGPTERPPNAAHDGLVSTSERGARRHVQLCFLACGGQSQYTCSSSSLSSRVNTATRALAVTPPSLILTANTRSCGPTRSASRGRDSAPSSVQAVICKRGCASRRVGVVEDRDGSRSADTLTQASKTNWTMRPCKRVSPTGLGPARSGDGC